MSAAARLRCPTWRARFRAQDACPRCGTELVPLGRLAWRAWRLQEETRHALAAGRFAAARAIAARALRLHRTPRGVALAALAAVAAGGAGAADLPAAGTSAEARPPAVR